MTKPLQRWLKFNLVGVIGVGVQLVVLTMLMSLFRWHYLAATIAAVEAAILHNFVWHERWTWLERRRRLGLGLRLFRFNFSNGLISIAGNLFCMWLLVSQAHIGYLWANLVAIIICSFINFLVSDRLIFQE